MATIGLIMLVLGVVLLFLAAFGVGAPRVSLGWLGLAVIFLAQLFGVGG
jgi:hypothetical protein